VIKVEAAGSCTAVRVKMYPAIVTILLKICKEDGLNEWRKRSYESLFLLLPSVWRIPQVPHAIAAQRWLELMLNRGKTDDRLVVLNVMKWAIGFLHTLGLLPYLL